MRDDPGRSLLIETPRAAPVAELPPLSLTRENCTRHRWNPVSRCTPQSLRNSRRAKPKDLDRVAQRQHSKLSHRRFLLPSDWLPLTLEPPQSTFGNVGGALLTTFLLLRFLAPRPRPSPWSPRCA